MTKIIHQIWLGTKPLPPAYAEYAKTWQQHFPGWTYKLWRDADVEALAPFVSPYVVQQIFAPVVRADLLRIELLRLYGGMYADLDYECLVGFEDFLLPDHWMYADEKEGAPGNAWFYAPAGHPFGAFLAGALHQRCSRVAAAASPANICEFSGPGALHAALNVWIYPWSPGRILRAADGVELRLEWGDIALLRHHALSPFWPANRRAAWLSGEIKAPHARAVHHYGWSWR
jgi:hypothetical protein